MPELKHHFRAGRMNKDLDERLVPNGEYRDAQNVEIITSEGSDVGSVQNVTGNQRKDGKSYDANTKILTLWGNSSNSIKDLTNAKCIGHVTDTQNDKLYWFIAATGVSAIAEYSFETGEIKPVLVDKNNILKYSSDYLITGANVIEGLLLWTDNQTEPKKIKISSFKSGSTNFNTHTTFNGAAFTEDDITTAKLSPLKAPTLTMSASKRSGAGIGLGTKVYTNFDFTEDADGQGGTPNTVRPSGQEITLNFTPTPSFIVGDIVTLRLEHTDTDNIEKEYTIKVLVKRLVNSGQQIKAVIQSIPTDTPIGNFTYEASLDGEDPLFENKFVRFAYRWKYKDGEYSTFSPFSSVAFLPSDFEYKSTDGRNVGMSNNLRQLTVNVTESKPADVDEIDILYKESTNNLVYVADTLKEKGDGTFPSLSYEVTSEIIGSVVQSNQILRPWDNVPRLAKAQEVTANRLIYANYLQNYNILQQNLPDIQTTVSQTAISTVASPEASLKSSRTYQVGGVYIDKYGRETPVFSNKKAAKNINKSYANTVNKLSCKMLNDAPEWATHFKYFVKETSNEYYNVSLDRFYMAEDGNIWLSFPSSERNKVSEDSYLILKKQHDKDTFVAAEAKYKVLDISNEAPEYIKKEIKTISSATCLVLTSATNAPAIGRVTFQFRGPKDVDNPVFARGFTSDSMITITTAGGTTERYEVASGGITGKEDAADSNDRLIYEVTLKKPLKDTEVNALSSLATQHAEFTLTLYQEQKVEKPEFFGRFFVKINRDTIFDLNIIDSFPASDATYGIIRDRIVDLDSSSDFGTNGVFISVVIFTVTGIPVSPTWFEKSEDVETLSWKDTKAKDNNRDHETGVRQDWRQLTSGHPVLGDKQMKLYFTGVKTTQHGKSMDHDQSNVLNPFLEALSSAGTYIQFENENGFEGSIYEIEYTDIDYQYRSGRKRHRKKIGGKRREYTVNFKNVKTGEGFDDSFSLSGTGSSARIKAIRIMKKIVNINNETLSSENPAIFETEPKEAVDLELFYEASNSIPILKQGMKVTGTNIQANTTISSITDENTFTLSQVTSGGTIADGSTLTITSSDDVYLFTVTVNGAIANGSTSVVIADGQVHGQLQTLDWFNCYSFGNGVESNRINDDFNAPLIDKGPKVSSVLAEQYKEDQKQNGLIFSGIFNSTSGVNRLNQFIQAEPITKDINPHYGSIQKLKARDTDLITFCEDKIIRILANKDALFNADGNPQLTATNRVLGQAIPYVGDYGISRNPESFSSHAYRIYFTDKARGAVLRLSRDGLTNIAQKGMTDWFKDNLATSTSLLGSYDQYKGSYNLTLKGTNNYTVCFDERVDGWTSFKSFIPEDACSLNNTYYSFKNGDLFSHDNTTRNKFYDVSANQNDTTKDHATTITVLINDMPSSMKSFKTLNYEGTKSRKYTYAGTINSVSYSNLTWDQINPLTPTQAEWTALSETVGKGWYAESIETDKQSGIIKEFNNKEGKWFNYIKGEDTTLTNLDSKEFSVQGLGKFASLSGDVTPTNKNVTVSINNTTSSHNTDVSATVVLSKAAGASISESVTLTIKPNTGFVIDATSFAFVSETSSTVTDAMGTATFAQSGDNVIMTVPLSFTMPSNDQTVQVNITGAATANNYSVAGTFDVVESNTTSSPANIKNVAYSGTGAYNTTAATVFTKTFTAKEDKSDAYTNMNAVDYTFDTNTSDSDPGAGEIKFNNSSAASVTEIYIDDTAGGVDKQSQYALLQNQDTITKGFVRVADNGSTTNFTEFKVSAVTHNTGYWKLTVNTPTAGSGGHVGIAANTKDVTFFTVDGFKFNVKPTAEIIKQDEDDISSYTITESNWDGDQNQITFTVKYVYSTNNPTTDKILFTAHAEKIFVDPDTQVTAFFASSKPISRRGETRTMTVAGMEGVTFKFTKQVTVGGGSPGTLQYWNGTAFTASDTTLTMGNTGVVDVTEVYSGSSSSKTFAYKINATTEHPVLGGNLDSDSDGDHEFTIGQNADVTFTIKATEDSMTNIEQGPDHGEITKTYYAFGEPDSESDAGSFKFETTVQANGTSENFTVTLPQDEKLFTQTETVNVVDGAASGDNVTLDFDDDNHSLVAGMLVEGTGVPAGATIGSVTNSKRIVLANATGCNVADNAEITIRAANDWEWDLNNIAITPGNEDNSTKDTCKIEADIQVLKYGTTNLASEIKLDNCLQLGSTGGGGGGGSCTITTTSPAESSSHTYSGVARTYSGGGTTVLSVTASPKVVSGGSTGFTIATLTVTGQWEGNIFANDDVRAALYIPSGSDITSISHSSGVADGTTQHNISLSGASGELPSGTNTGTISGIGLGFSSSSSSSNLLLGVRIWRENIN